MKTYLVGGAVRDHLLHRQAHDRDWVVVGSTEAEMLNAGFTRVGNSFPVFLHPVTGEQYALARTERKVGRGHVEFTCDTSNVTLEDDLRRRDFTINAMAMDPNTKEIIDPCFGQRDIDSRIIRHVSDIAFAEDPLRVLRAARFSARLQFSIHPSTMLQMKKIVESGELLTLSSERVWGEIVAALKTQHPSVFFKALLGCGALAQLLPEVAHLVNVPQSEEYHFGDAFTHTMAVVDYCATLPEEGWAALCHDLGKAATPFEVLPHHYEHELASKDITEGLCKRLKVPNRYSDLAIMVAKHHMKSHKVTDMQPNSIVRFLVKIDAYRRPAKFTQFLTVCLADSVCHVGGTLLNKDIELLRAVFDATRTVTLEDLDYKPTNGLAIGNAIREQRVRVAKGVVKRIRERWTTEENKDV